MTNRQDPVHEALSAVERAEPLVKTSSFTSAAATRCEDGSDQYGGNEGAVVR